MTTRTRLLTASIKATAVALALLLWGATAAFAAEDATISHVETSGQQLEILVSVPPGAQVDLGSVSATVAGKKAATQAVLATSTTAVRRTAVLVIDTSNSMRGKRFKSAKAAALEFLDAVPADVYVGIIAFAGAVSEPLAPTLDRDQARTVVGQLSLSKQTLLYDAILAGVAAVGDEGQRNLVVLSDGADTSDTSLSDVTSAISDAEVLVDVVSARAAKPSDEPMRLLVAAGNGRIIEAGASSLRDAFSAEAEVLARQVLVTAQIPDSVDAKEGTVAVRLPTGSALLTVQAYTTLRGADQDAGAAPSGPLPTEGWTLPAWGMYAGVGALGLGIIAILLILMPKPRVREMTAESRVATYTQRLSRKPGAATKGESDPALAQAKQAAAQVLSRSHTLEDRIAVRLEGAGSELRAAEWLLLHTAIFVGAGIVGLLLGGGSVLAGILFLLVGAFVPWIYLGFRRSRRRKAFNASLPDTLQLMSGSLAAGLSLAQSVDTIVREGVEPIGSEFKRVLVETRLGVSLEDAFDGRGPAFRQQGLRLGRHGDQDPATGRWQPRRAPRDGRRDDA